MKTLPLLYHDFKFACRSLRIYPIFSCVVCCVLALGIGANTALFTVVNTVLLQPLPFNESERLVDVHEFVRVMQGVNGKNERCSPATDA